MYIYRVLGGYRRQHGVSTSPSVCDVVAINVNESYNVYAKGCVQMNSVDLPNNVNLIIILSK